MPRPPARPLTALLAGATGLIGRELLGRLLDGEAYTRVTVVARRALSGVTPQPRLEVVTLDFARPLPEPFVAVDDVYIALGTTLKVAGSPEAFRQVDFELVVAIARAARAAGATRLGVVSALGADVASRVFYNRVKGEMQDAVSTLGYAAVVIAQPSLLIGDRGALGQPVRGGEVLAARLLGPVMGLVPARVRPIAAADVAAALRSALLGATSGVRILGSGEMQRAARA